MSTSLISSLLPSNVSIPAAAPQGTQKPKNKTDETAQKQLSEQSAIAKSTALIIPNQVRKFKDQTSPILYDLFCRSVHNALETYNSETTHNFASSLSGLIAEFAADDDLTAPVPSVSKSLSQGREFVSSIGFGKKMWNDYFGDIGAVPPLPKDICAILTSACPFFSGKTVAQTHRLVLIPETLNGTPMTLERLGELMRGLDLKQGKTGYDLLFCFFENHAEIPFEKSHWVLMTNTIPEVTRSKCYDVQKGIIERHANYQVPKLAQAAVAIFMEYVATGTYRYGRDPWTYTRCQEASIWGQNGQMAVGGFAPAGLVIRHSHAGEYADDGVAALWKFL